MTPEPIGWGDYLRLMLVLLGIVALAVAAIRFWIPKMSIWNKSVRGPIQICARLPLDQRKTLYIVKAANTYWLLAGSEAGVQNLAELNAEECARALGAGEVSLAGKT